MPPKAENGAPPNSRANGNGEPTSKSISAAEKRRLAAAKDSNNNVTPSNSAQVPVNNPSTAVANANGTGHAHDAIGGMNWDDVPNSVLHTYRSAYRLRTACAMTPYASMVLSCGIGKKSPTSNAKRNSRDALITTVRKHFNSQPINENEAIVNFLYTVKNQDKSFRLRFPPGSSSSGR